MHSIVLAGGYATRLWPITERRPKMLLPIGDTTVLDRILADLEVDDRIERVYVSTNERFETAFREHLAERPYEKPVVTVERTSTEDEKLGVVGALAQLVEREGIDEDTVVIAGDNLMGCSVSDFVDYFARRDGPALAAYDVGSTVRAKSYGLVELNGETVVGFQEKPDRPESTLVSIACYGFTPAVLRDLPTYLDEGNNPDEPGWFIQWLQNRTRVSAFTFDEAWFDIGTLESYLDAVAWHLDGEQRVSDRTSIENAEIGSNAHVMAGAEVVNSVVENAIVFPNATIENSLVRSSIVDRDARIDGVALEYDLVGEGSWIQTGDGTSADQTPDAVPTPDGGFRVR